MNIRATVYFFISLSTTQIAGLVDWFLRGIRKASASIGRAVGVIRSFSLFGLVTPYFSLKINHSLRFYLVGYVVVVSLLFGVNAILSLLRGTFYPDGRELTKTLLDDRVDLINYLLICPAYTLVGLQFITRVARLDQELSSVWTAFGWTGKPKQHLCVPQLLLVGFGAVALSHFMVYGYMRDFMTYNTAYWCHSIDSVGEKSLGLHGYYYWAVNWILNIFMVCVGLYHLEVVRVSQKFGIVARLHIGSEGATLPIELEDEDAARLTLAPLADVLVLSKVLIATFMINALLWKWNEPEAHGMLDIGVLALFFLGVGYFAFPRYHVQFWLYQIWKKHKRVRYADMRQPLASGISALADSVLLGTAAVALFADTVFYRLGIKSIDYLHDLLIESIKGFKD